jgi:hypothetical protein
MTAREKEVIAQVKDKAPHLLGIILKWIKHERGDR